MVFQIPLHFEDLTRSSAEQWRIRPTSFRETPADSLLALIRDDPTVILTSQAPPNPSLTALYTLFSHYSSLSKPDRSALVDLTDALVDAANPTNPSHVKLASFLVAGLATTASATTPPCKFWEKTGRESTLEALSRLCSATPCPSPFADADLDQLAGLLVRTILQVLEQPSAARDKNLRAVLARLLATALALHPQQALPAVTALLHALNRHEHLPAPLAELLARLSDERPPLKSFVSDFVREIARLPSDGLARDPAAAKGCATFLGELSERLPDVFRANLALVLSQLDGDSYAMRNGVVHVIGTLIRAAPDADDPLLDVLMERSFRDIHAFTRSKALQTWISLAEARVIPNRLFSVLADMAASRLDDKTAAVRKYAAQLLACLLRNNPFGPALHKSHFQEKLAEVQGTDEAVDADSGENADKEDDGADSSKSSDSEGSGAEHPEETEKENDASFDNQSAETSLEKMTEEVEVENADVSTEESQSDLKKRFYTSAVKFIQSVETGLETVYNMLRSKSITDVSEAVSLLITAVQFQLEAASGRAVRKMLPLVLARENNIRQAAVNAYVRLLAPGGLDTLDEKESAMGVATGLAALGVGATTGELACLEALIAAMPKSEETSKVISSSVVTVLWDIFAGKVPGASDDQRRAACMLVGMVAADRTESLQQRVQIIASVGLVDPSFARWSCVALCKLPPGSDSDGRLSQQLADLGKDCTDLSTVEQALNAIFVISPEPELTVGSIIRDLARSLHTNPSAVPVSDLSRFLQVVGHVAVKELVRIEALVSQVRKCATSHARNDGNNEEEEQASAEADKALELAEKELISPPSLLGRYGNLARKIASDRSAPAELQASSVLCMAKLMCVQEKFCESNLRLLFSILSSAPEPLVRSNAVTALGDLAFRFPNLVEPWSSHIYSALKDKDDQVRKNTLMALTHLILNDMVKVKGQIVNLAICILDKNDRIADLARLFFHELARKSANAIYNILPDTISCMSRMEDLKSDDFKTVVSFLVALMDKERHADGMVEKLCHRFRTNESERENRDLAYCISQLNISERGVKKMNDSFKSFSTAICDDVVHGYIMQAVNKGNKSGSSTATSETVEELTAKIDAIRHSVAQAEASHGPDTAHSDKSSPQDMAEAHDGEVGSEGTLTEETAGDDLTEKEVGEADSDRAKANSTAEEASENDSFRTKLDVSNSGDNASAADSEDALSVDDRSGQPSRKAVEHDNNTSENDGSQEGEVSDSDTGESSMDEQDDPEDDDSDHGE